jgi:hypothetical protein
MIRQNGLGWMIGLGLLALLLSPILVLVGDPVLRPVPRYRGRAASIASWRQVRAARTLKYHAAHENGYRLLLMRFRLHPMVIALTAPSRWARDRVRRLFRSRAARRRERLWLSGRHEGLFPDDPPFLSGVREPRRPKPKPPADGIALQPPTEDSLRD